MNESIMKTDKRGRLRYTQEQKKTMVEAYQASGLSAPRFATLHGVNYQTLVSWIKKGKEPASAKHSPSPNPAFFPLVPAEVDKAFITGTGRAMEVLLSSGTKIIITSSDQLDLAAILISKLENSRPC
jgi:transposase-like protein